MLMMKPMTLLKSIFLFALLILAAGCGTSPTSSTDEAGAQQEQPQPNVLVQQPPITATVENPSAARSYSDTFEIRFDGATPWVYQLTTRSAKGLREVKLHMEGLRPQDNPGDIRLVTDGITTWMNGEGTDRNCIQFPAHQGMDPSFIVPESLAPLQSLQNGLGAPVEEEISGKKSLHYSGSGVTLNAWADAHVDGWLDKASGSLIQLSMQANGDDPFFGTGAGKLTAHYEAMDYVEGDIQPVKGCEIPVPLPDKYEAFVRLPEMASFESSRKPEKIVSFYQDALPQAGWAEAESPSQDGETMVLSYARGDEEVDFQVTPRDGGGSRVKLLFGGGK